MSHSAPHLTGRELETLRLINRGLTNKEIAAAMGRSVKTVEKYRFNLLGKFQVSNAVDLLRAAINAGAIGVAEFLTVQKPPWHHGSKTALKSSAWAADSDLKILLS